MNHAEFSKQVNRIDMNADIIIVGLGPTGATLAALLGQRGIRVAAFDKLPSLYPLPRAIGMDHEAMRIMQELGIADRVLTQVAPYCPSEYRGMEGQLIKRLDMTPAPFRIGWAPNYVFNQPAVEGIIRERLTSLDSVDIHLEAEVLAQGQDSDGVWVDVRLNGQSEATRVNAKYLVACDGGSSPIRTRLCMDLEDLDFHEPWLVVDAIINDDKLADLPQTQVQYCEAERPSTFVILPGNHRRREIMLLPGDSLSPDFPEAELWPLLERWITPSDGKIWRAAAYRFHGLVANDWRQGRIFLAGDAAHMTPPFMAQGMVQGLRDAANLAWKFDRVLSGCSPDSLLDTYQQERRPHTIETTKTAIELGRVICERDPELARQRDKRLLSEQGGEVRTVFRQNMIPDLKYGLIASDTRGVGALFPQPWVRSGSFSGWLDDLVKPSIRVLVRGEVAPQVISRLIELLTACDGSLLHLSQGIPNSPQDAGFLIEEQDLVMATWLTSVGANAAIVRPDNYVYATEANPENAPAQLERLIDSLTAAAKDVAPFLTNS